MDFSCDDCEEQRRPSFSETYAVTQEEPLLLVSNDVMDSYQAECFSQGKSCLIWAQQHVSADLLWIRSIQQVGKFIHRLETPYFFDLINNITALQPQWSFPYAFTQTIGPIPRAAGEDTPEILAQKQVSRTQTIQI